MKYEVQTYTAFDGWVNCWKVDGETEFFDSEEAAQDALDEFFDTVPLRGYIRDDYRIVAVSGEAP